MHGATVEIKSLYINNIFFSLNYKKQEKTIEPLFLCIVICVPEKIRRIWELC
jgi:hypothetical protein